MNELDCYFGDCTGSLEYCGGNPDDPALYRCRDCGDEYNQAKIEELAEMDGPTAKLAKVLLAGHYDD